MAGKEDARFWEELLAAFKERPVQFGFKRAENGCMEETHESVKLRIAAKWGFEPSRVALMEADMKAMFELGREQFNVYSAVRFQVNGKGWSTDFEDLVAAPAYDDEKKED